MSSKYLDLLQKVYKNWRKADPHCFSAGLNELHFLFADENVLKAEVPITKEMTTPGGFLHGGCTPALIDIVSTLGLHCREKPLSGVSVNLNVSYIGSAKLGDSLIIESQTVKVGKTLAYLNIMVINKGTGKVVATGTHVKHLGRSLV